MYRSYYRTFSVVVLEVVTCISGHFFKTTAELLFGYNVFFRLWLSYCFGDF